MISASPSAAARRTLGNACRATTSRTATSVRHFYQNTPGGEESQTGMNDLIMSILEANPSTRDAKGWLNTFAPKPKAPQPQQSVTQRPIIPPEAKNPLHFPADVFSQTQPPPEVLVDPKVDQQAALELLNPMQRRTALVKFQGPFTDRQLESICRGMVYLEKLGLVSVIVVERDDWQPGDGRERVDAKDDVMRITAALEAQGANTRPILEPLVRLGPPPAERPSEELIHEHRKALLSADEASASEVVDSSPTEVQAHARLSDLVPIRSALQAGEIPVLAPLALDSFQRMVRVDANDVVAALVKGMVQAGRTLHHQLKRTAVATPEEHQPSNLASSPSPLPEDEVDLTPLRLMVINREGGIPSYARHGLPHLLINLTAEDSYIRRTFNPSWHVSHPTSLSNLSLSQACLKHMPPSSSAIVVSHRSPRSLIANLITNKPAQSSSLPATLLTDGPRKVTPHTPTLIRNGLPMRVIPKTHMEEIDRVKMTTLLEASFKRTLDQDAFYSRLEKVLDYVIVAGDYAGACIVTEEPMPSSGRKSLSYLDKFAVHPSHQGDGTVDFLWVALHDESFGLGSAHALNPNEGGKMGFGTGRDLVWRSRSDNPANRWYYERSSGHLRLGHWTMFWCDAEDRLTQREDELIEEGYDKAKPSMGRRGRGIPGLSFVEGGEEGRLDEWADIVKAIPGSWSR